MAKQISITEDMYKRLEKRKAKRQSFTGVIEDMIETIENLQYTVDELKRECKKNVRAQGARKQ